MSESVWYIGDEKQPLSSVDAVTMVFAVLTEVTIIHQQSTAEFNKSQDNELHLSHFSLLNRLVRFGDPKTPQSLADEMGVTKATMTNSLAKMSERGLIKVTENPTDKRSKLVAITVKGRKVRDKAIKRVAPNMADYAQSFDKDDLVELFRLLRRFHASMSLDTRS
ncbi:MAG: MarR family transcriptional regulator [Pseudomonadota bacterium]